MVGQSRGVVQLLLDEKIYTVDLKGVLITLRRRMWLIVLLPLMTGITAYAVCRTLLPVIYEANTTLLVSKGAVHGQHFYNDILLDRQLVKTYREIARSDTVLEQVISDLRLPLTLTDLRKLVRVSQRGDTELIQISVEHPNAHLATIIANSLAESFIENVHRIVKADNIVVVDKARLPERPAKPRSGLITAGVSFAGLLTSICVAFLSRQLDFYVRTPEDVSKHLELPLLAEIPRMKNSGPTLVATIEDISGSRRRKAVRDDGAPQAKEAYRALRTSIQFYGLDAPARVLLVTSALPREGKTTTVANLAVAFAQAGKRVIAIDGDLRRPSLHKFFNLSNLRGLSNALMGEGRLDGLVQQTDIFGLELLASGPTPPNPPEILSSPRFATLVETLSAHLDVVIIDSPPVLSVTDPAVISHVADGVVVVAGAGMLPQKSGADTKAQLDAVKARLLGVVLNYSRLDDNSARYTY